MSSQRRILVVAPHADDEVLGCGGTMAKSTATGDEVSVLILGKASEKLYSDDAREAPLLESKTAHEILGVRRTLYREFPAPMMDTVPIYKIANAVREAIIDVKPDTLYVPHRGDVHQDHRVVFDASLVAARPVDGCPVKKVLAYETLSETEWAPPTADMGFVPNVFLDVTEHLPTKLKAIEAYVSQIREKPHPRSTWGLTALANFRGSTVGVQAAESFQLVREIG